jgi:BirA family transcriptional regulator, biotin operon repressor / biotin---[acetyl-CoA-carboxylase] ligase
MSTVEKLDRLLADQLQTALSSAVIGREIVVLEETTSTNDAIFHMAYPRGAAVCSSPTVASAEEGSPSLVQEGLVLFAEQQSTGRGQRGNRWESAAGKGLWFSILLRPQIGVNESWRLTVWAIEAISDVIRAEFALDSTIKMPNDVQLHGRKVAGVLVEMRAQQKAAHVAVVGIGVNANQSDFPGGLRDKATSLAMTLRRPINRQKFAVALLRQLDRTYRERFLIEDR